MCIGARQLLVLLVRQLLQLRLLPLTLLALLLLHLLRDLHLLRCLLLLMLGRCTRCHGLCCTRASITCYARQLLRRRGVGSNPRSRRVGEQPAEASLQ